MNKTDFILFSGAAAGAEAEFGACAERHGIEEVNFTFDGHKDARSRGIRVLNHEELQAGDVSLEYVSRLMHRRYTDSPTIRKVLQTLWYQVNNGQEIYVVGVDPRRRHRARRNGLGRRVRQAVQQAALRLRSGEGRLVRVDRLATGRAAAATRRSSRIRTSPAPARASSGQRQPRHRGALHEFVRVVGAGASRSAVHSARSSSFRATVPARPRCSGPSRSMRASTPLDVIAAGSL